MEQLCDPGAGAPLHTHFEVEESIVVVGGEAEVTVDGVGRRVLAGEAILLPAGSWHGFVNVGSEILHTVAVFGSAAPAVAYADEPDEVYEIGVVRDRMRDAHRAVRDSYPVDVPRPRQMEE
jgi:mannose-6-phosphate isomerase-like protein (cupin superfamily)